MVWLAGGSLDDALGIAGSGGQVAHRAREGGIGLGARAGDSCRFGVGWEQHKGGVDSGLRDGAWAEVGLCGVHSEGLAY